MRLVQGSLSCQGVEYGAYTANQNSLNSATSSVSAAWRELFLCWSVGIALSSSAISYGDMVALPGGVAWMNFYGADPARSRLAIAAAQSSIHSRIRRGAHFFHIGAITLTLSFTSMAVFSNLSSSRLHPWLPLGLPIPPDYLSEKEAQMYGTRSGWSGELFSMSIVFLGCGVDVAQRRERPPIFMGGCARLWPRCSASGSRRSSTRTASGRRSGWSSSGRRSAEAGSGPSSSPSQRPSRRREGYTHA